MAKLIDMRKLVAVDMASHGRRFILAEFTSPDMRGISGRKVLW